jgi:hypothetical protein
MGSVTRKIGRRQELAEREQVRKAARDTVRRMEAALTRMSRQCSMCEAPFDPNDFAALDKWHISVTHDATTLTCPECKDRESVVQ